MPNRPVLLGMRRRGSDEHIGAHSRRTAGPSDTGLDPSGIEA